MMDSSSKSNTEQTFSQVINLPDNKVGSSQFPGINCVKILKQKVAGICGFHAFHAAWRFMQGLSTEDPKYYDLM